MAATVLTSDIHLHEHPVQIHNTFIGGGRILHKRLLCVIQLCTKGPYWLQITKASSADESEEENKSAAHCQLLIFLLVLGTSEYTHCYYQYQQSIPGKLSLFVSHFTKHCC